MEAEKTNRFYCGHCEQEVSRRTLYTHKRLYYNRMSKEWSKQKISYAENAGIDRQTPDVRQGGDERSETDTDDVGDFESADDSRSHLHHSFETGVIFCNCKYYYNYIEYIAHFVLFA